MRMQIKYRLRRKTIAPSVFSTEVSAFKPCRGPRAAVGRTLERGTTQKRRKFSFARVPPGHACISECFSAL